MHYLYRNVNYYFYERFIHSLGVAHLAEKLIKLLRTNQPELNITDEDVLCVKIAGIMMFQ